MFKSIKHPKPVLCPEYPWEEKHTYLYGSVIELQDKLRMYYQSYVDGIGFFVCLAESEDGINWKKPLIRPLKESIPHIYPTVEVEGRVLDFYHKTQHLECMSNVVASYHIPSVIHNPEDEYPYKLFGYTDKGYCVAFSKDGINFVEYENNPVIPLLKFPNKKTKKIWYSDVAPVFYDKRKRVYRAMVKTYKIDKQGRTRRCVGMSISKDFINWSKPKTVWIPSEREDRIAQERGFNWADFYGLCPFNYKDHYLGFLWLFMIDHEFKKGTHDGKIEVYLAYSKDCRKWELVSDEPIIPLGKEGEWDSGTLSTANQPLSGQDRLIIYYSGGNGSHGCGEYEKPYDKEYRACIGFAEILL
ncbi:hypothetical protein IAE16_01475 [Hydrogenobacter sp. T-2]|uniref:hypothetical protein n=1 Tax=Pampinifervens diazotrophicum TaxID=1632018 RepID=UPI002B263533|nr:hypothetical protein [Hydrogenobacter sp. T-2]WPM32361.1 hypothetical protein IAE16_01475 [Hydrogenobacter sp. T-2]